MEPRRRFRFVKQISEGTFGKVYMCEMLTDSAQRLDLTPNKILIDNIGTGVPKTVLQFAEEEYQRLGGKKCIRIGSIDDRPNEVKSYCAQVSDHYKQLL